MTSEVTPDVRLRCCRLKLVIICFLDRKTEEVEGVARGEGVGGCNEALQLGNDAIYAWGNWNILSEFHPSWRRYLLIFTADGNFSFSVTHWPTSYNSYSSPNFIGVIESMRMRWAGHVARMGEMRNAYTWLESLKGRVHSEGLGVDGRIKMDLGEIEFGVVNWIHLAQDTDRWRDFVNTAMNLWFHKRWEISWLAEHTSSFSRRTLLHGVGLVGYLLNMWKYSNNRERHWKMKIIFMEKLE
jgi:hypothetical protein